MNKVKLIAPEGATSANLEGETFEVADGVLEVPACYVDSLVRYHGFTIKPDEASAPVDLEAQAELVAENAAAEKLEGAENTPPTYHENLKAKWN